MKSNNIVKSSFLYFVLGGLFCALSQIACFNQAEPAASSRGSGPEAVFMRNCAVCHGSGAEGKLLGQITVPSLKEGKARSDPDSFIRKQISDGGGGMPAFKYSLSEQEISDLLGYIRHLQGVEQASR
jgi:mono/diheme cytochrome c family protein